MTRFWEWLTDWCDDLVSDSVRLKRDFNAVMFTDVSHWEADMRHYQAIGAFDGAAHCILVFTYLITDWCNSFGAALSGDRVLDAMSTANQRPAL